MPHIGTLPRAETGLEAISKSAASLFDTINKLKQIRRDQEVRRGLMDIIGSDGSQKQIAGFLSGQPQAGGNILSRILDTLNPTTPAQIGSTSLENSVMSQLLGRSLDPTAGLQREYLQSRIDSTKALTEARKRPKPTKTYDIATINQRLYDWTHDEDRKPVKIGQSDLFTLREMLKGTGYRLRKLTTTEKKKQWFLPEGLEGERDKVEWILEDSKGQIVSPVEEAQPFEKTVRAQSAPDTRLDPVWPQLSEKQKEDIWKRFEQDPASIEAVLEMIHSATP